MLVGLTAGAAGAGAILLAMHLRRRKATPPPDFDRERIREAASRLGLPTPYEVTKGGMVTITGTISREAAEQLLRDEANVAPRPQEDGRVPAGVVLANFTESSIGPHTEAQFFVAVRARSGSVLPDLPAVPYAVLLATADGTLCTRLFNNTPACASYNGELLRLQPRLSAGEAAYTRDAAAQLLRFDLQSSNGATLVKGHVAAPGHPQAVTIPPAVMVKHYGMWELLKSVVLGAKGLIVQRGGDNLGAPCWTGVKASVLQEWSPADCLEEVGEGLVPKGVDFRPSGVSLTGDAVNAGAPFYFLYLWQSFHVA